MGRGGSNSDQDGHDGGSGNEGSLDAQLDRALPSEAAAFLMVVAGEQPGRVHPLSKNTIILGRNATADIKISDRSVSGEHARIINASTGYEIEDLGSTNGTFVGARKVMRARLKNGDRVRIGSVEFAFLVDRESDATVALISAAAVGPSRYQPLLAPMPAPAPPAVAGDDEGISLREMVTKGYNAYQFLRRYGFLISVLLGAGATVGFASAFVVPPPATAFCQVKLSPAPKSNPVDSVRQPDQEPIQFFESAEIAFTNPELIRTTMKNLGEPVPTRDQISSIASRLTFTNDGTSRVYRATFRDTMFGQSRQEPTQFLSAHMQTYLKSEINKTLKVFNAEYEFLHGQVETVEKQMAQINAELVQFREGNVDRLPDQATQTYASGVQMATRRQDLTAQIRRLEGEVANARHQLVAEKPLSQSKYQASQAYRDGVANINKRLTEARAKGFGDEHPEIKQLMEEKRQLELLTSEQLKSTTSALERGSNAAYQALENTVAGLEGQLRAARAEAADIDRELQHVRRVVGDLPRVEAKLQDLRRAQEDTQRLHAQLFDRLKKAELQLELERVSVSSRYEIVSAPQMESTKKKKTILIRTASGLAISILLIALVIFVREGRRIISETLAGGPGSDQQSLMRT